MSFYENTITEQQLHEYHALRKELEELGSDIGGSCMLLGIDQIYSRGSTPLPDDEWGTIMNANKDHLPNKDWTFWQILPNRLSCVRYSADEDDTAFRDFKDYAKRANSIFDRYDDLAIPEGLAWRTRPNGVVIEDGHFFLLKMVLNTDPTLAQFGFIDGLDSFDPVVPHGLSLSGLRCESFFEYAGPAIATWIPPSAKTKIISTPSITPIWDADKRELSFNDKLIKAYKVPPTNQEIILAAFQSAGWRKRIENPLSPGYDNKRQLNDALRKLNRGHKAKDLIEFNSTGTGIIWLVPASKPPQALPTTCPAIANKKPPATKKCSRGSKKKRTRTG